MLQSRARPWFAAALIAGALSACGWRPALPAATQTIEVSQVRELGSCNGDETQTRLTLLDSREAVLRWQQARDVDIVGVDPLPDAGAYVVAELGVRPGTGFGFEIARQGGLSGGVVSLVASQLTPDATEAGTLRMASPCVLVALPAGGYRDVELRDPAGKLLARTDAQAPVQ